MKRNPRRGRACRPVCVSMLSVVAILGLWGCSTQALHHPYKDHLVPIAPIGEVVLQTRIAEIDEAYREPRADYRVEHSLGAAVDSISPKNHYAALWRAVRACAWLGLNHPLPSQRWEFARRGVGLGLVATRRLSARVEPYYYTALCYKALSEARQGPTKEHLKEMKYYLSVAKEIDGGFDHCGALRELGSLYEKAADPGWKGPRIGNRLLAVDLLEKACDGCPDFGANQFALARALRLVGQYDRARLALDRVLRSSIPTDYSVEHRTWLHDAQSLREKLTLLDDRSVEATAYREDTRLPSDADGTLGSGAAAIGPPPPADPTVIESERGTLTVRPDGSVAEPVNDETALKTDGQ